MVKHGKIVFDFKPEHLINILSYLANPAEGKNHREQGSKTKKRPGKDQSFPAKKPRLSETNKGKLKRNWECAICTLIFSTWYDLNVHVKSAHEETHEKTHEEIRWPCEHCGNSYSSRGNLNKHVKKAHSVKSPKEVAVVLEKTAVREEKENISNDKRKAQSVESPRKVAVVLEKTAVREEKENISNNKRKAQSVESPRKVAVVLEKTAVREEKENISNNKNKAHSVDSPREIAVVLEKTAVRKEKENVSNNKRKAQSVDSPREVAGMREETVVREEKENTSYDKRTTHSVDSPKDVAGLREKTGVMKDNSHSTGTLKVPATKFTKYKCRCGKTEDTYDASVRHAQTHLVQWEALIKKNGTQCELEFDRYDVGDNDNRSLIKTKFDYKTLLKDSWLNMFKPTEFSSSILSSSLYKYTRCVKLNWDSKKREERDGSCVPLYRCGACNLFVEPAKVQRHCENYGTCVALGPKGHKCPECQKCFSTLNALRLHKEDHETHTNLQFRIVTFNDEGDVEFNKALKRMSFLYEGDTPTKGQRKISENPEILENNVLEKTNDIQHASQNNVVMPVSKYCALCKRSYSDLKSHSAYHEDKRKRIMDTFSAEAAETATNKRNNGNTKKEAERKQNVSDNNISRKDPDYTGGNGATHKHNEYTAKGSKHDNVNRKIIDRVIEWDSDSDNSNQSFRTFSLQAQLATHFRRIATKEDEVVQKTFKGNRKKNDDVFKEGIGEHDQFNQCELTLSRMFGGDDNRDTFESDNESQSTEDLQRVLEDNAGSVLSDDE